MSTALSPGVRSAALDRMTADVLDVLVIGGGVTGAGAALDAASRRGLTGRTAVIEVDGGELMIVWEEDNDHVFMTGPVEVERTGALSI